MDRILDPKELMIPILYHIGYLAQKLKYISLHLYTVNPRLSIIRDPLHEGLSKVVSFNLEQVLELKFISPRHKQLRNNG